MSKTENQKLKLLILKEIFERKSDESHGITMMDIMSELEKYEITATRKTIYSDIELLRELGMDIEGIQKNGTYYYYLLNHSFELAELKLMVDSVQSSKFITKKKSDELIKKIEGLTSVHDAKKLQRQVFVKQRVKTMNESIYYNVDTLNEAISNNCRINFKYYEWNVRKELVLRGNGNKENISPWGLSFDDENYYLIAYDSEAGMIKHYRVDKMREIQLTDMVRDGQNLFKQFDTASYTKKIFGMYGGREENVDIEFENRMVGVVIDRFGSDIMLIPSDETHFKVHVDVVVSNVFFSWIMSLGSGVRIVGPQSVIKQLKEEMKRIHDQYEV